MTRKQMLGIRDRAEAALIAAGISAEFAQRATPIEDRRPPRCPPPRRRCPPRTPSLPSTRRRTPRCNADATPAPSIHDAGVAAVRQTRADFSRIWGVEESLSRLASRAPAGPIGPGQAMARGRSLSGSRRQDAAARGRPPAAPWTRDDAAAGPGRRRRAPHHQARLADAGRGGLSGGDRRDRRARRWTGPPRCAPTS